MPTLSTPARLRTTAFFALILTVALLCCFWTTASAAAGWQPVTLPNSASVTCLTTDARLSIVYACTANDGVLRIKARAPSAVRSTGIPNGVSVQVVQPSPGSVKDVLAGTSAGIYRSTDGGSTFSATSSGIPAGASVTALAFGAHGSTVLAGTASNGIYRSTNGGATWSADNGGREGTPKVNSLTFDPRAHIFVAASAGSPLSVSNTAATHWGSAGDGLPQGNVSSLTTLASGGVNANGATLYATTSQGVFDSQDDGQSWHSLLDASHAGTNSTLAPDLTHVGTLYLGTTQTVLVSQDGGNHWHLVAHGISGVVTALAPLANGANTTVYAVGSNGLFSYQASNSPNLGNTVGEGIIAVVFLAFCYWIWRRTRRTLNLTGGPASRGPRGSAQNTYKFSRDERLPAHNTPLPSQPMSPRAPSPTAPSQPRIPRTRARTGNNGGPLQTPQTGASGSDRSTLGTDVPPDTHNR